MVARGLDAGVGRFHVWDSGWFQSSVSQGMRVVWVILCLGDELSAFNTQVTNPTRHQLSVHGW